MNVLIADDHEIVRDGLAVLLQDFFDIDAFLFASNGDEAIEKAHENHTIDLVLLDLSMPNGVGKLSGFDVTATLRSMLPQAFIIIFSMFEEEAYQKKAFGLGVNGYLVKRQKGEEIIRDITKVLHGEKIFHQSVLTPSHSSSNRSSSWNLPITDREKQIFLYTVSGYSLKAIAGKLHITPKTVENHRRNIGKKLGTAKKTEWIELAKKYDI